MEREKIDDLLNRVHLGDSINFMTKIPDEYIDLTISSPPFYADEIYILEDGPEFGWATYHEYLEHLEKLVLDLYRITKTGGKLCLILTNTPKLDKNDNLVGIYPIVFDLYNILKSVGWELFSDVVWNKTESSYHDGGIYPNIPNTRVISYHDWILIFSKQGERNSINKKEFVESVWTLPPAGPIKEYNDVYNSFPDELVRSIINLWSIENDIIFDPYAGSGQVTRIALQMNRNALGVEIDARWQELWEDINQVFE